MPPSIPKPLSEDQAEAVVLRIAPETGAGRTMRELASAHRGKRRKKLRTGARPDNIDRDGIANTRAMDGKPLGNGSDPQDALKVVAEPQLHADLEAKARALEEARVDSAVRSYRPGTKEHAERLERERKWALEVAKAGDVLAAYILARGGEEV